MTKGNIKAVLFIDAVIYLPVCLLGTWFIANILFGPSKEGQEIGDAALLLILGSSIGLAIWLGLLLWAIKIVKSFDPNRAARTKESLIGISAFGVLGLAVVIVKLFWPLA